MVLFQDSGFRYEPFMAKQKLDTQAIGLDIGLAFSKWLTGAENLHYGFWDGLDISAANLRAAQEAYTDKLFALLPDRPCRILDIGGGAGETAKKLIVLGHTVEIVVPSAFLAGRCRENAPEAVVHEMPFEDFAGTGPFDVCLFSESYQYIPLEEGLSKCLTVLTEDGVILIADCFRSAAYRWDKTVRKVGGGHKINAFRAFLEDQPVSVLSEEDITRSVAPSVDVEQGLFNVVGYGLQRTEAELSEKRPKLHWILRRVLNAALNQRRRTRLDQRLNQQTRNAEVFCENNVYLLMALVRNAG
jgi:MPBQ/MSBQ methyltransferase